MDHDDDDDLAFPAPVAPGPADRLRDAWDRLRDDPALRPALWVAVGLAVVGLAGAGAALWWVAERTTPPPPVEDALPLASPPPATDPSVLVHAAGAVRRPGLYELGPGARVADLLDAAGGALPDADLDRLNLAATLADGAQVLVPREGEVPIPGAGPTVGAGVAAASAGPIDVNVATAEQLESLPGIGPALAAAVVRHRDGQGPFGQVDDLLAVPGIGPAKLDGLRDLVVVG